MIAGGDQGVAHRVGELHCGARLGCVQGRAGVVDVESRARGGSAVRVDADYRVWSHPVGLRGALIDARSGGVVVTARQLDVNAHLIERTLDPADDIPRECVFRIAGVGGGTRRVALFGPTATVGDLLGQRGVVDAVVARVEEYGHSTDTRCRLRGVEHRADTERCGRDGRNFQDIAPRNRQFTHRAMVAIGLMARCGTGSA